MSPTVWVVTLVTIECEGGGNGNGQYCYLSGVRWLIAMDEVAEHTDGIE